MRIVNLIENTPGADGCVAFHGLSFYVETAEHRVLFDAGPSAETLDNAARLGIDLGKVDVAGSVVLGIAAAALGFACARCGGQV